MIIRTLPVILALLQSYPSIQAGGISYEAELEPCFVILDDQKIPWVHIGTLTIKKRAPEHQKLEKIVFSWQGRKITSVSASLYKKSPGKNLMAVEKNFLCDGQWSRRNQELIFSFNEPVSLEGLNEFCLVFTVTKPMCYLLKKGGYFKLATDELPDNMNKALMTNLLTLDLRNIEF